jgi:hypothetical protein
MDLYSFPQKNGEEGPDFEVGGRGIPWPPFSFMCIDMYASGRVTMWM